MLGIEFLIRAATEFNEPGVLMAFEETPEDTTKNGGNVVPSLSAASFWHDNVSWHPSSFITSVHTRTYSMMYGVLRMACAQPYR